MQTPLSWNVRQTDLLWLKFLGAAGLIVGKNPTKPHKGCKEVWVINTLLSLHARFNEPNNRTGGTREPQKFYENRASGLSSVFVTNKMICGRTAAARTSQNDSRKVVF
jgi:hypothetical protein